MQRIIDLIKRVNRPGVDNLIKYLHESNFASVSCRTHHTYKGGLADHSFEVYKIIKRLNLGIPEESIIVCALLHDLGKAQLKGWDFKGQHPARAIAILERCGFELHEEEAFAIRYHHRMSLDALYHRCRNALTKADMESTATWKKRFHKLRKKDSLYELVGKLL